MRPACLEKEAHHKEEDHVVAWATEIETLPRFNEQISVLAAPDAETSFGGKGGLLPGPGAFRRRAEVSFGGIKFFFCFFGLHLVVVTLFRFGQR